MNSKKKKTLLEELYQSFESDTEDEDYVFKEENDDDDGNFRLKFYFIIMKYIMFPQFL
jgi:hypothetical protein